MIYFHFMDYEIENDVIFFLLSGLSLVQVQQVPFEKGTKTYEITNFIGIESVNYQDMGALEPVISRT